MPSYLVEYKKVNKDDVTSETRHVKTIIKSASELQGTDGILGRIAASVEGLEFLTVRVVPDKKPQVVVKPKETK